MRIVLAYSGSLEGSAAIGWLRDQYAAEVVAVTLDLGQGRELEAVRDRALALGAQRAHVLDTREQFAQEFVLPALRADALHDGRVPMALALSRPLIARNLVDIAAIERADAVAHTGHATGAASQLDHLLGGINEALTVVTPAREWQMTEADLTAFARRSGLGSIRDDATRIEANFWGRSLRQPGSDATPGFAPRSPGACPAEPASVDITFARGVPTALNGVTLPLLELAVSLGTLATTHGVGHARSPRLVCEAPAAVLLHAAHRELVHVAADPHLQEFSSHATAAYIAMVEGARWFTPLREALDAYFTAMQTRVNGHVRLRLFKGGHSVIATELVQPQSQPAAPRIVPSRAQH
jgi:argininosuccinate synthase